MVGGDMHATENSSALPQTLDPGPSTLAIRDAIPADAPACAAIYNTYVGRGEITFDLEPKTPEFFAAQLAGLQPREAWIVLEDGATDPPTTLAYGVIRLWSDRTGYAKTCETSVYVHPDHQRQGYGTTIKRALIERCRALGYHHLIAKVVADNAASVEYNRRLGYELVGIQREVGWVDVQWRDVAIMQLILD